MLRALRLSRGLAPVVVVLATAAVAPAAARAVDQPGAGGAIRISAAPSALVLGRDAAAELTIAVPPGVEDVQLSTNVGRIDEVRRLPGGGFAARYRPSGERLPQVAIVAAVGHTGAGMQDGWLAIPLSGQGDAKVPAAPGSRVALRIGDRSFGPRTAQADGVAVIPIVVPPGVRQGHHGFRPVDLRIPETSLVHAVQDRTTVIADREERVRVVAYGVAPHGAARRGDAPILEPSRGSIALSRREPGVVSAVWTLPPGRAGEERLVVRLPSSPATRTVLRVQVQAGPPAVVAVSFDRDALVAGTTEPATVTARALDAGGNAVPAAIELSTDAGVLEDVREPQRGTVQAHLRVPSFPRRREVRVTASLAELGISGSRALRLRPGEPARAEFAEPDGVLRADGRRPARLRLSVTDRFGNPVDASPVVTAGRGKILGVSADGLGAWNVTYAAPRAAEPIPDRLVASVGPIRAEARRVLLPPEPRWAIAPTGGVALDLRGRFESGRYGLAVERAMDKGEADRDLAWRVEADVVRAGVGTVPTILGGVSAAHALGTTLVLRGSLTGGLVARDGYFAPAARVALAAGAMHGRVEPFVEAAALAARRGEPGAFSALGLSAGIRFGLERR